MYTVYRNIYDDWSRKKIGVVCAIYNGEFIGVGASVCNPKDKFDKVKGRELAEHRAQLMLDSDPLNEEIFSPGFNTSSRDFNYSLLNRHVFFKTVFLGQFHSKTLGLVAEYASRSIEDLGYELIRAKIRNDRMSAQIRTSDRV